MKRSGKVSDREKWVTERGSRKEREREKEGGLCACL